MLLLPGATHSASRCDPVPGDDAGGQPTFLVGTIANLIVVGQARRLGDPAAEPWLGAQYLLDRHPDHLGDAGDRGWLAVAPSLIAAQAAAFIAGAAPGLPRDRDVVEEARRVLAVTDSLAARSADHAPSTRGRSCAPGAANGNVNATGGTSSSNASIRSFLDLARLDHGDFDKATRAIVQRTAELLATARVSVWLFNAERSAMVPQVLFMRADGTCQCGLALPVAAFPATSVPSVNIGCWR
ncbi:MAG: hypothetical protein IPK26_22425, partial [Planctomycetes bacterium]|nr:hypothetical protein [Planctomycetota bacterium]